MRKLAFVLILAMTLPAAAQTTCGNGLPCGPIPWALPLWATLQSPTPFPTEIFNPTPTPSATINPSITPTVTNTPTVTPTATVGFQTTQIGDGIATLQGFVNSTPIAIVGSNDGTALGGGIVTFWGYLRGISEGLSLGVLTPLFTGLLFLVAFTLAIQVIRYTLPLAVALFGFLRKIVELILEFIPL